MNNRNNRPLLNFIPYIVVSLFLLMMVYSSPSRSVSSVLTYKDYQPEDYTETGLWLLETLKKHDTK